MTIYELQFDVVEPMIIFETFSNFGLKITNFYSLKNTDCITFEGTYDQLKRWSMENYDFSENDFGDYFDEWSKLVRGNYEV